MRSWKKSEQTRQLIFWSYGSYLQKTKRQKYDMNGKISQPESLQPLLHMLTDEHLTLIVQQNLGPRVIGIKVHLRQSKGTLALWKPIRNTKFDKIQVWRFSHIFGVFSEDMNFASTLATQLSIYCNNIFIAKYIVCMISKQNRMYLLSKI